MIRSTIPAAFALAILALLGRQAAAEVIIAPGNTDTGIAADSNSEPAGAILVAGPLTISGTTTDGGSYRFTEEVFKETGGTYDFLFQVKNTGTTAISGITLNNYTGYSTLVGYETIVPAGFSPGTVGTPTVSRGIAGDDVKFVFVGGLGSGATSNVFNVQTNASSFDQQGLATLSGPTGGAVINDIYEPSVAVPEPSSLALCGIAGAIALAVARGRRKRPA